MQDLHFQEDEVNVLFPISLTKHNLKPWTLYKRVFKLKSFKDDSFDF